MPYRLDLRDGGDDVFDRLIELGALDVERFPDGATAALMPDAVTSSEVARALGIADLRTSPAVGRDAESVWLLAPRPVRIGRIRIVPASHDAAGRAIRLIDGSAFGTGLHPTTALCLEALDAAVGDTPPAGLLDVGTGSGVLALAALTLGVPRAVAIDTDAAALAVAAENARINGLDDRLDVLRGGPEEVTGTWPLVLANVVAGPLIEMAPALVRRVDHHGRLVLSGIPSAARPDVEQAYVRLGMKRLSVESRAGWVALALAASW